MLSTTKYDEITSMDQIDLDDFFNLKEIPCVTNVVKSTGLLEKKIYLYREKEVHNIISSTMKPSHLELFGAEGGKPKYIPVFEDVENGNIYLSDKAYNTYSFRLLSALSREYDKKNEVIIPEQHSVKDFSDILDLSLCRLPNRESFFMDDGKIVFKSITPDAKTMKEWSRRDSIMSNIKIKYIFSTDDNLVHDKSCEEVGLISNEHFMGSETVPEGRTHCEKCYLNSLIRKGCGDDFKKVNLYKKFFRDGGLKTEDIEKLIVNYKAKIHMDTTDILHIKCNEDSWLIKKGHEQYMLFHNSYTILDENSRYISKRPSFHSQGTYHKLLRVLSEIEKYSWEGHLAHKAEVERAKELQLKREKSFFYRLRKWFRNLFSYFKSEVRNDNSSRF